MEEKTLTIETMTAAEAASWLRKRGMSISPSTLIRGIKEKLFPFGDYVPPEEGGQPRTYVYTVLLEQWAAERMR